MRFTRRQYEWVALIGAALLAILSVSGCTAVRYLPQLPAEWRAPARDDNRNPCITEGQAYLSCPPRT